MTKRFRSKKGIRQDYMATQKSIRDIFRELIWDYKAKHPCVDCGEADPIVLEFDHRDRLTKKFNLSEAVIRCRSLEEIVEEIGKCDIRCANCHRRKTHLEGNYGRVKLAY